MYGVGYIQGITMTTTGRDAEHLDESVRLSKPQIKRKLGRFQKLHIARLWLFK